MLVHHFLEENAEKNSYRDAAVHLGGRINYLELEAASNRLANYLIAAGIKPQRPFGKTPYTMHGNNKRNRIL